MKVFVSWSGQRSQALGDALRDWIPTDDRFRKKAARLQNKLALRVENPAKWYPEVIAP